MIIINEHIWHDLILTLFKARWNIKDIGITYNSKTLILENSYV